MNSITCELNGIKYLTIDVFITSDNKYHILNKIKKYNAIQQSIVKKHIGGFFSDDYAIIKILVPEKNVIDWNDN